MCVSIVRYTRAKDLAGRAPRIKLSKGLGKSPDMPDGLLHKGLDQSMDEKTYVNPLNPLQSRKEELHSI
jgi:hypothetical protein